MAAKRDAVKLPIAERKLALVTAKLVDIWTPINCGERVDLACRLQVEAELATTVVSAVEILPNAHSVARVDHEKMATRVRARL